ncbi:MAG: hypothetical protein ACYTXT_26015 [Nostoc sp.]
MSFETINREIIVKKPLEIRRVINMSAMIEAIERIATYYSSFDAPTSLDMKVFYWMLNNGYDAVGKDVRELRKSLSPETLQKVVSSYSTPKLTLEQIQEITRDYPFQLLL